MYNDASNEDGIFIRMGDSANPYGSWYTRVPKNSERQARIDLAIKKYWVNPDGNININDEYGVSKSVLDTTYIIEFPKGSKRNT